ncbi:tryptophan halogenase family protein [Thalassotalea litorea]|uniref:tryptophan halogenase family protein n=1 Tax=Thalassotalea litorea TaxID=2020715 RepID=UPI0037369F27
MEKLNQSILVVGGGTAGWLSAAILAKKLNAVNTDAVKITLVESPNIPILGVGEGTWPTIRTTLETLGIDEGEFMRECDATFKQGSEFVDWVRTPAEGEHSSYFHPLSAVFHSSYDFNLAPYWLLGENPGLAYDESVASQTHVCKAGLAPKLITTKAYDAIQNYSYHLNANKFAKFLSDFCQRNLGVQHVLANVEKVNVDLKGMITSVETDTEGEIVADFFLDCTGTKGLLIGETLGVEWKKIDDVLFNDTALAMQVPYEEPDSPIATHTISTAQEAGWIWDIGLHHRRGIGYVYSSKYSTDERAEQILRQYAGKMGADQEIRKIPLNLGYRQKFWHKNCVAIGMSAAFIEPLEASAIFLVEAAANMLAEQFPRQRAVMPYVEEKFNDTFRLRWDKSVDFVKLHYCISKRCDTRYWSDNRRKESIPESLQKRLAHWKYHPPGKYDFDYAYEPFVLDSYLFVLYGMEFDVELSPNQSAFAESALARMHFKRVSQTAEKLLDALPKHRELIEKIYRYGVQKI